MIKKVLIKETQFAFSAIPSINTSRQKAGEENEGNEKASCSFPYFFRFF